MANKKVAVPKLSDKQYRTVAEYFDNGFNKRQAMIAAGYSKRTATTNTQQTFDKPQVKSEVARRHALADKAGGLDKEWIVSRLKDLADSSVMLNKYLKIAGDGTLYHDFSGATLEELKYIKGITVDFYTEGKGDAARIIKKFKVDPADPLGVLTALARIEGLFQDRLKLEGDDGVIEALQAGRRRAGKPTTDS